MVGCLPTAEMQSFFSTAPADWANRINDLEKSVVKVFKKYWDGSLLYLAIPPHEQYTTKYWFKQSLAGLSLFRFVLLIDKVTKPSLPNYLP